MSVFVACVDPERDVQRTCAMTIEHALGFNDHRIAAQTFPFNPGPNAHELECTFGAEPRSPMSQQSQSGESGSGGRTPDAKIARLMVAHLGAIASRQDRAAFEDVFRYFGPRVKAYMLKLGADNALAEELMQETMVSVWRKADKFDPAKAAASTWIFTIARNLRIDAYRKMSRPEPDPNDPAFVPDGEVPADAVLMQSETAQRLRDIIATLPQEQRTMLQLSYFQDKSHSEISEAFGIPLGTVKSRLRLAMQKVRHALGDDE